jgi:hypothetical protein
MAQDNLTVVQQVNPMLLIDGEKIMHLEQENRELKNALIQVHAIVGKMTVPLELIDDFRAANFDAIRLCFPQGGK